MIPFPVPSVFRALWASPSARRATGRAGELLATYYLERCDIPCSVVDRFGVDIWAQVPDGHFFTLEVKSSSSNAGSYCPEIPSYTFKVANKKADQFMLICLDTALFRIMDLATLNRRCPRGAMRLKGSYFTEELMWEDIRDLKARYSFSGEL